MGRRVLMARLIGNVILVQLFICPLGATSVAAPQDECLEGSCPSQGSSQIQINSHLPPLENIQMPSSQKTKTKAELEYELWSKTCACGISDASKVPQGVLEISKLPHKKNLTDYSDYYAEQQAARDERRGAFEEYIQPNSSETCVVNMETGEQECYTPSWDILIHDECFDLCWNTYNCPCMVTQACRCILESCKGCDFCNSSEAVHGTYENGTENPDVWEINPYGPEYDPGNRSSGQSGLNMCPEWDPDEDIGRGFTETDLRKANCRDNFNAENPTYPGGFCDNHVKVDVYEHNWDEMDPATVAAYEDWLHNNSHVPWSEIAYSITH